MTSAAYVPATPRQARIAELLFARRRDTRASLAHHALYSRGWKPGVCAYCGPRVDRRRVPVKRQGRLHVCADCVSRNG